MSEGWLSEAKVKHAQILLNSYRHWMSRDLIPREGSPLEQAEALFSSPFVIVSHDSGEDPILNYGNRAALDLWEMTWDSFIHTPSRLTTEIINREDRTRMLKEVAEQGFSENYRGVRISSSGKRFTIKQALVWNLLDEKGREVGQAATFSSWKYL